MIPQVDVMINFGAGTNPKTGHPTILGNLRIESLQNYWLACPNKPHIIFGGGTYNPLTKITRTISSAIVNRDFFLNPYFKIIPDLGTIHINKKGAFDTFTEALAAYDTVYELGLGNRIGFSTSDVHEKRTEEALKKAFGPGYEFFRNPYSFSDSNQMNEEREKLHLELFHDYWGAWPNGQIPYSGDRSFFEAHPWFYDETLKIIETTRSSDKESMKDSAYMKER